MIVATVCIVFRINREFILARESSPVIFCHDIFRNFGDEKCERRCVDVDTTIQCYVEEHHCLVRVKRLDLRRLL